MPSRRWSQFCSSALLGLSVVSGTSCLDAAEERSRWHDWKTLRLEAESTLLSGQVELRLVNASPGQRLETETRASFLGAVVATSNSTTTFDSAGEVLEYASYSRKRGRRYSFSSDGYTVDKLRPRENADEAADPWEVSAHEEFTAPSTGNGGGKAPLFDYFGMLLHLREMKLDRPGDEEEVYVATSKGPQPYLIRVSETRATERQFTDLATGTSTTLPLRELRLTITPTDPEAEEGFLRMVGETEIWVEAESRALLEIAGRIPRIPGTVRLVLSALE